MFEFAIGNITVTGGDKTEVVTGALQAWTEQEGLDLVSLRTWALNYLNTWRGARRAALGLTPAAFQELVYTGKVLECQRWMAAKESNFGLAGEAAARGLTNEQMAGLVLAQWAAWAGGSDSIEAAYITARAAVSLAESVDDVGAVLAGLSG